MFGPAIFLILLLTQFKRIVSLHPQFYPCESNSTKDGHVTLDCQHRKLTTIPIFSSSAIVSLNLNENHINHVRAEAFSDLPNLRYLSLMWNCVPDYLKGSRWPSCSVNIDPDAFIRLKKLTFLQLAGNSLKVIPPLPKQLVVLGLEFNNIFQISKPLGTPKLKQLLLNKNCFYANPCFQPYFIAPAVFQDLPELLNLTLGYNNLTVVPPNLPVSLESLDLRENKIESITKKTFANLDHLKHLNLGWNCQRCDHASDPCFPCPNNQSLNLDPNAFQVQRNSLISLNLQGNSLRKLPRNLFQQLHKLQVIDLSSNFLAYTIQNGTFYEELKNVVSLSLLYNYEPLIAFPELVLSPLIEKMTSLKNLYLSGLFFRVLSKRSLAPLIRLPRLESLDLRMNFICDISIDGLNQLRALKRVDLSQNMLAFNPCFSTCSSQAQPRYQTLDKHNQETTSELIPTNKNTKNHLTPEWMVSDAVQTCQSIGQHNNNEMLPFETIPKSKNLEKGTYHETIAFEVLTKQRMLENVSEHVMTNHDMQHISSASSESIRAIQDSEAHCPFFFSLWIFRRQICSKNMSFDLSQNNIPWLNASTFKGMENVVCLDLSYNYISQTLDGQQFSPLTKVAYLNMAYNRIDLYSNKAFREIRATLTVLDLSNNEFHFVMKGMGHRFTFLKYMSSLTAMSLANNHIGIRISNILNSTSLKYLIFSGNRLDMMWDSWRNQYLSFFQGLTSLTHLDISVNQLKSISPEVIANLPLSLQVLRVDLNMLTYFPWANLSVLQQLCYLNLSSNLLSFLPNTNFNILLAGLDLSHNQIVAIPKMFFSQATNLKNLMLNNNQLKIIDVQVLPVSFHEDCIFTQTGEHKNRSSCKLVLHENPFACSCVISTLAKFLRETDLYIPHLTTQVHCGFPESLAGVNVLSVDLRSCQEIFGGVAFLCTSLLTLVATIIPLLKHLYGWDLWYLIQILWTGHKGHSPVHRGMNDNQYDAFVVFNTKNNAVREWIYKEMIVRLENRGRWQFRLCLEERDWLPGVSCIENLHKAVYSSRKTVFVLNSPSGCTQVTGVIQQAFLMVQQRLLDEKLDVTILVLLDPLFPKLKYLQMRKRLCKKSVLSWPRNPRVQPLFWNSIRVALVSDNIRAYDKNVTESFF